MGTNHATAVDFDRAASPAVWAEVEALRRDKEALAKALRDVVYQKPGDAGAYSRAASLLHSLGMAQG